MKTLSEMDAWDSMRVGINAAIIVISFALYLSLVALGFALGDLLSEVISGSRKPARVAVRDVPYQPEQPAKEAEE